MYINHGCLTQHNGKGCELSSRIQQLSAATNEVADVVYATCCTQCEVNENLRFLSEYATVSRCACVCVCV